MQKQDKLQQLLAECSIYPEMNNTKLTETIKNLIIVILSAQSSKQKVESNSQNYIQKRCQQLGYFQKIKKQFEEFKKEISNQTLSYKTLIMQKVNRIAYFQEKIQKKNDATKNQFTQLHLKKMQKIDAGLKDLNEKERNAKKYYLEIFKLNQKIKGEHDFLRVQIKKVSENYEVLQQYFSQNIRQKTQMLEEELVMLKGGFQNLKKTIFESLGSYYEDEYNKKSLIQSQVQLVKSRIRVFNPLNSPEDNERKMSAEQDSLKLGQISAYKFQNNDVVSSQIFHGACNCLDYIEAYRNIITLNSSRRSFIILGKKILSKQKNSVRFLKLASQGWIGLVSQQNIQFLLSRQEQYWTGFKSSRNNMWVGPEKTIYFKYSAGDTVSITVDYDQKNISISVKQKDPQKMSKFSTCLLFENLSDKIYCQHYLFVMLEKRGDSFQLL